MIEIKKGTEIGRGQAKYIYHACIDCGKERWIPFVKGQPASLRCNSCKQTGERNHRYGRGKLQRGELNPNWQGGGKEYQHRGYVFLYQPDHPRANCGYIKRAILVLEEKLGRPMKFWMVCHHKNGIKNDDRPENLEELTNSKHIAWHWEAK